MRVWKKKSALKQETTKKINGCLFPWQEFMEIKEGLNVEKEKRVSKHRRNLAWISTTVFFTFSFPLQKVGNQLSILDIFYKGNGGMFRFGCWHCWGQILDCLSMTSHLRALSGE